MEKTKQRYFWNTPGSMTKIYHCQQCPIEAIGLTNIFYSPLSWEGRLLMVVTRSFDRNVLNKSFRLGLKILLSFISKSVDPLVLYYIFYYKKIDNKKNTAKIFRHFFNWIDDIKINWYLSFLLVVASTIDSCLELGVLKCYRFVFIVC